MANGNMSYEVIYFKLTKSLTILIVPKIFLEAPVDTKK